MEVAKLRLPKRAPQNRVNTTTVASLLCSLCRPIATGRPARAHGHRGRTQEGPTVDALSGYRNSLRDALAVGLSARISITARRTESKTNGLNSLASAQRFLLVILCDTILCACAEPVSRRQRFSHWGFAQWVQHADRTRNCLSVVLRRADLSGKKLKTANSA